MSLTKLTRIGKEPCGECHLQEGEVCDICGAKQMNKTTIKPERSFGAEALFDLNWFDKEGKERIVPERIHTGLVRVEADGKIYFGEVISYDARTEPYIVELLIDGQEVKTVIFDLSNLANNFKTTATEQEEKVQ